jgi:hypothetical protein
VVQEARLSRASIVRAISAIALLAAAVGASGAGGAAPPAPQECAGIPTCIDVPGPWVAVPARGEARFLLECPQRRGVVGGIDSLASSRDVHVTFDGLLGSPVAPGRTTTRYAFFRALSGHHRAGLFEPRVGCIPSSAGGRSTTSARGAASANVLISTAAITPAGAPVDLAARFVKLSPGVERRAIVGCANGEQLVDSWDATAFAVMPPPAPALAGAVRVQRVVHGGQVAVTIAASETLPPSARAEVQIGVICTR